jgi:hypothetical protein
MKMGTRQPGFALKFLLVRKPYFMRRRYVLSGYFGQQWVKNESRVHQEKQGERIIPPLVE